MSYIDEPAVFILPKPPVSFVAQRVMDDEEEEYETTFLYVNPLLDVPIFIPKDFPAAVGKKMRDYYYGGRTPFSCVARVVMEDLEGDPLMVEEVSIGIAP